MFRGWRPRNCGGRWETGTPNPSNATVCPQTRCWGSVMTFLKERNAPLERTSLITALRQQTRQPPSCKWQGPATLGISSGWENVPEAGGRAFIPLPPARWPGRTHRQVGRFLSTDSPPRGLGQRQALISLSRECCLCPNCSLSNYEWNFVQNGCGISGLFDSKRIQYSVILENRKEINSLLNRIAI